MAESVVVGVRVRPFNEREKNLGAQLCVQMDGPTTSMLNVSSKEADPIKYTFDESFWSHDGFENDADGYSRPLPGSNYADQAYVFNKFGKRVLDNAWDGFHCCLFAYGQTGAGKSYSMVGWGNNKGIVPITCENIFGRIQENNNSEKRFEVVVSVVEIYMEKVHDLLVDPDKRKEGGLDIRESKMLGVYIDGVKKRAVDSYAAIDQTIEEATQNRTVASTLMNATSSRAHTVLTIEFKQIETVVGSNEAVKISMINLVDLAGSEKQKDTAAKGEVLKQATAINKSLSALGMVIEKLAQKSQGKKNVLVPYRDSKLTRLLQNALGGSSKTIMICALSPASTNYEETLSTLRYADRAKQIKNVAKVNENPQEKLMRELREENAKLKVVMEQLHDNIGTTDLEQIQERIQEMKDAQVALAEYKQDFGEKVRVTRHSMERSPSNMRKNATANIKEPPQIVNLNQDMLLSGRIKYKLPEGKHLRVGRAPLEDDEAASEGSGSDDESTFKNDFQPDVIVTGANIFPNHAVIRNDGDRCVLRCRGEAAHHTFVRGVKCSTLLKEARRSLRKSLSGPKKLLRVSSHDKVVTLNHGDTLAFDHSLFLFVDPAICPAEVLILSSQVSFTSARKELAKNRWDIPKKQIQRIISMKEQPDLPASISGLATEVMQRNSTIGSEIEEMEELLDAKDVELQEKDILLAEANGEKDELKRMLEEARRELAVKEAQLQGRTTPGEASIVSLSSGVTTQKSLEEWRTEVDDTFDEMFKEIGKMEHDFA
eukprot:CAMPEP_0172805932 /NCGR_PEP_ID=MMETSP1075-20121228/6022_1 /TAXON_ID=2916 /ORGANISM="Ceratium fusus, Strain PA161109" /LENGTH=769 /DNA_ID=CAMNT_0013644645 /DNA_START=75 /DNA_END=2384 /DNA_ORIENTATION=-